VQVVALARRRVCQSGRGIRLTDCARPVEESSKRRRDWVLSVAVIQPGKYAVERGVLGIRRASFFF
jgi:hypothetical protein